MRAPVYWVTRLWIGTTWGATRDAELVEQARQLVPELLERFVGLTHVRDPPDAVGGLLGDVGHHLVSGATELGQCPQRRPVVEGRQSWSYCTTWLSPARWAASTVSAQTTASDGDTGEVEGEQLHGVAS